MLSAAYFVNPHQGRNIVVSLTVIANWHRRILGRACHVQWRAISFFNRPKRFEFTDCLDWPNLQYDVKVPRACDRSGRASQRGSISSKWCSSKCSRRHVTTVARRSILSWCPQREVNTQIFSMFVGMYSPTAMTACQRGSIVPFAAGTPRSRFSAAAMVSFAGMARCRIGAFTARSRVPAGTFRSHPSSRRIGIDRHCARHRTGRDGRVLPPA